MKTLFKNRQLLIYVLSIVIISVFFGVLYRYISRDVSNSLIASRQGEIRQVAGQVQEFLLEGTDSLRLSAYRIEIMLASGADSQEIRAYLEEMTNAYMRVIDSSFTGIYGVFRGEYIDGTGWTPAPDFVAESRPWYMAARKAGTEITMVDPYYDLQTGTIMMSLSKGLSDMKSVISMDVALEGIRKIVKEFAAENDREDILVLDDRFFVVGSSDRTQIGADYASENGTIGRMIADCLSEESDRYYHEFKFDGVRYLMTEAEIEKGWYAVSLIKQNEYMRPVGRIRLGLILILMVILFSITVIYLSFRNRQRELTGLKAQLKSVAGIYEGMYYIDIRNDTFSELMVSPDAGQILGERHEKAQYDIRAVMDEMTESHFKKAVFDFIDFSTLGSRLNGKRTIMREFVSSRNERCCIRFIPVTADEAGQPETVVVLIERYS